VPFNGHHVVFGTVESLTKCANISIGTIPELGGDAGGAVELDAGAAGGVLVGADGGFVGGVTGADVAGALGGDGGLVTTGTAIGGPGMTVITGGGC
jgi:hypothetical protein